MAICFDVNRIAAKYNSLLLIPFLAGALDILENSVQVIILSNIAGATKTKIFVGALAANIKWLLVCIGIVMTVCLTVRWFFSVRTKQ